MGNWSERQEVKKEVKEKDKVRREKLAGYFFDLSKLSFAGLVIGITLPLFSDTQNATMWLVAMFGIVLTVLSALLANKILKWYGSINIRFRSRSGNSRWYLPMDIHQVRQEMACKFIIDCYLEKIIKPDIKPGFFFA